MTQPQQPAPSVIPADGVEFELTLATAIDPMAMVRLDGCDPTNWKYNGQGVVVGTGRFKLVRVGYCRNLDEVWQKLGAGNVPVGQWREAFKQVFPRNDGRGPIGFADASYMSPGSDAFFPVLYEYGLAWRGGFHWANDGHDELWRWLVACHKDLAKRDK